MVGWEASIGLASRVSGKPAVTGSAQRVSCPQADCLKDAHHANTSIVCALDCSPCGCDFDVVATPMGKLYGRQICRVGLLLLLCKLSPHSLWTSVHLQCGLPMSTICGQCPCSSLNFCRSMLLFSRFLVELCCLLELNSVDEGPARHGSLLHWPNELLDEQARQLHRGLRTKPSV
jgi:hypothetical protein